MKKYYEINGNLKKVKNYETFLNTINKVLSIYEDTFGIDLLSTYDLYIDNAKCDNAGYTPTTLKPFNKYVLIKLGVWDFAKEEIIVFQLAHEMCHYIFYTLNGLDNKWILPKFIEENIATCASLIVLNELYPSTKEFWQEYVNKGEKTYYNRGAKIAKRLNYNINDLKELIYLIQEKYSKSI